MMRGMGRPVRMARVMTGMMSRALKPDLDVLVFQLDAFQALRMHQVIKLPKLLEVWIYGLFVLFRILSVGHDAGVHLIR
jgi:hypothetical protein